MPCGSARSCGRNWKAWESQPRLTPLGIILSMEGADPVVSPEQVDEWWNSSACASSARAHYGRGHYAYGTGTDGPLGSRGVELLRRDGAARHDPRRHAPVRPVLGRGARRLRRAACWPATTTAASLVPGDRQLTDEQIKRLIERGAVIGVALDAWMLYPGWVRGKTTPRGRGRSTRSPTTSTASASSPATAGTAASAPTSTAASAPSRRRATSTPSPTCRSSPTSSPAAAMPRRRRRDLPRQLAAVLHAGRSAE